MSGPQLARVSLWMTGSLLSFSAMALAVRALAGAFSTFEILAIRTGAGLLLTLAVGALRPHLFGSLTPRRLGMHFARNGTHLAGQYMWTASLTLLPFATVFALEFTMPAWTTLLAALLLAERMTPSRAGVIACGFVGALVILKPGFEAFKPAALLVLAAAFSFASSNIATKKLTSTETTYAIVFWMNVMQLPLAYAGSDPLFFLRIEGAHLPAVAAIGIAGLSAHFCLANALAAGDASVVIPFDFMRLPLIAMIGWLLYHEPLELSVFAGAGLIVLGVVWNLNAETRRPLPRAPRDARGR